MVHNQHPNHLPPKAEHEQCSLSTSWNEIWRLGVKNNIRYPSLITSQKYAVKFVLKTLFSTHVAYLRASQAWSSIVDWYSRYILYSLILEFPIWRHWESPFSMVFFITRFPFNDARSESVSFSFCLFEFILQGRSCRLITCDWNLLLLNSTIYLHCVCCLRKD